MTTSSKLPKIRRKSGPEPRPAYPTNAAGMMITPNTQFPPPPPATAPAAVGIPTASSAEQQELAQRREQLSAEFAQGQWNLGGLLYEMAIRDHFRLDVLKFRAARMQELDAELGEVERLLRIDSAAAGGECDSCGALYGRGAFFCWQCGTPIAGSDSKDEVAVGVAPAAPNAGV